jgi:hypothetical protein
MADNDATVICLQNITDHQTSISGILFAFALWPANCIAIQWQTAFVFTSPSRSSVQIVTLRHCESFRIQPCRPVCFLCFFRDLWPLVMCALMYGKSSPKMSHSEDIWTSHLSTLMQDAWEKKEKECLWTGPTGWLRRLGQGPGNSFRNFEWDLSATITDNPGGHQGASQNTQNWKLPNPFLRHVMCKQILEQSVSKR